MRLQHSIKRGKEILDMLEERVLNGEHLTIEGVTQELYEAKSAGVYLMAKNKVTWMFHTSLRDRLKKRHDLPFVCINDRHEYGIPTTQAEARFNITIMYRLAKGINQSVNSSSKYYQGQKLLPNLSHESISLPISK